MEESWRLLVFHGDLLLCSIVAQAIGGQRGKFLCLGEIYTFLFRFHEFLDFVVKKFMLSWLNNMIS